MRLSSAVAGTVLLFGSALMESCDENSNVPVEPVGAFNQIAPPNGAKEVSINTVFSWDMSVGADHYELVVSTKSDFSTITLHEKEIAGTTFTATTPLSDGVLYHWKVIAVNSQGAKPAENARLSFRTKETLPLPSPSVTKYFASPDGEDNPDKGTAENPFKTLAYAVRRIPAGEGDTLYLKAGTYIETEPAIVPVGVNVIGAGESSTILSSDGVTLPSGISVTAPDFKLWYDGSLIQLVSKHRMSFRNNSSSAVAPENGNQTLSGFTIDGRNKLLKAGVWVENRNNVTMHHVTFKNLSQRGAVFGAGDKDFYVYPEFYITGTRIHDCTFINSGKDLSGETLGNLCISQLDGADIFNINIQDSEGYGIKFIYDGYFKNCKIHNCQIQVNELDTKWGEDIAIELWNVGPGNQIYDISCNTWLSIVNHPEIFGDPSGTENMKVYNVKMIDKDGASDKEAIEIGAPGVEVNGSYFENKGFGIAIWDMGRKNITIRNNTFYNSVLKKNWTGGSAIYIDNSRTWDFQNINIFNNVFDTHSYGVRLKSSNGGISDVNIANNAFLDIAESEASIEGEDITNIFLNNNLRFSLVGTPWIFSPGISKSSNILGDPGFVRTGYRWENYYRPASGNSLVVDKGIDVGLPFDGIAPDIGAFEF